MYHGVVKEDLKPFCWWQISKNKFKWQMEYINKNYNVLKLDDLTNRLLNNEKLPDNTAIITFDDGYKNNYTIAYPILKNNNIPATIFLPTDYIGKDCYLWADQVYLTFKNSVIKKINLKDIGLGEYDIRSYKDKKSVCQETLEFLKNLPIDEKDLSMGLLRNTLDVHHNDYDLDNDFSLLNWEDVSSLNKDSLISFGAHSCTHNILSHLSIDKLNHEITNACIVIEKNNNNKSCPFSYPNGRKQDFTEDSKRILKDHGATCAVSTISGLNDKSNDMFELKRIAIGADTSKTQFKLMCSGIADYIKTKFSKVL